MSDPQVHQAPPWENVVQKCWSPPCENIAAFRDGMGWWWCIEHQDRGQWGIDKVQKWAEIEGRIREEIQKAQTQTGR